MPRYLNAIESPIDVLLSSVFEKRCLMRTGFTQPVHSQHWQNIDQVSTATSELRSMYEMRRGKYTQLYDAEEY